MLVAFGEFLQQQGLLERLRQLPVPQKTHDFNPRDKRNSAWFLLGPGRGLPLRVFDLALEFYIVKASVARCPGFDG
jgi:hypothetical protein